MAITAIARAENVPSASPVRTADPAALTSRGPQSRPGANAQQKDAPKESQPNKSGGESSGASGSESSSSGPRVNANKFRCRVAMACVHCRHRKIRCDGAQPSCSTCTRLQRKCEYERVSEHDNLLSRERKRLSRERKAARMAANAGNQSNNVVAGRSDDKGDSLTLPQVHIPLTQKSTSPTFTMPPQAAAAGTSPGYVNGSMLHQPMPDGAGAWPSRTSAPFSNGSNDFMPWMMPNAFTNSEPVLNTTTEPQGSESLVSLRSTADPSLLELSNPPKSLQEDSSLLTMPWSQPETNAGGMERGASPSSLTSASGMAPPTSTSGSSEPLDGGMDMSMKMFGNPPLPSSSATPSSVDTNTASLSDTCSSVLGPSVSMTLSPLSPQLPTPFDSLSDERSLPRSLGGAFESMAQNGTSISSPALAMCSASLPSSEPPSSVAPDLEPNSMPILSSWPQLTPSAL